MAHISREELQHMIEYERRTITLAVREPVRSIRPTELNMKKSWELKKVMKRKFRIQARVREESEGNQQFHGQKWRMLAGR
ncbi:UNVERIFIED_CONTAM: hypothetical protein Sradi_6413400 [Sesamum radiatum]|uniref:Uncharacterized protein n=1 Tax=Sesamum radiatum TaxID=300843 RepID=A0AAW2K3Q7_SESRA